jgi:hypothetical protein
MGARPEQQLTLNFLTALHGLWVQFPGNYTVEESIDDLVPALAQMCIKALAADIRDGSSAASQHDIAIDGRIVKVDGTEEPVDLRDVVNKIIHGTPTLVVVRNETVQLHFRNNGPLEWTEAWFSGTQLLQELGRGLYKHPAGGREYEITRFLQELGVARFLPTNVSVPDNFRAEHQPDVIEAGSRDV